MADLRFALTYCHAARSSFTAEVVGLRTRGHLVVTAVEAGLANKRMPDEIVLEYTTRLGPAVLTHNSDDFSELHDRQPRHAGIVACQVTADIKSLVERIDREISAVGDLAGKILKITK